MTIGIPLVLLLLTTAPLRDRPKQSAPAPLSVEAYRAELGRLETDLRRLQDHPKEASSVIARLPSAFRVQDGKRQIEISNAGLHLELQKLDGATAADRAVVVSRLVERVEEQITAISDRRRTIDGERARGVAREILARREFRFVQGATWLDRLWQRLLLRLLRFIGRIFPRIPGRKAGLAAVWMVAALAVVALILRLRRRHRKTELSFLDSRTSEQLGSEARNWLLKLKSAEEQGRWTETIHCAYWAAIFYLDEQGALRLTRERTPREYLREVAASDARRLPLQELTRSFERVWYAGEEAEPEDCHEALRLLEGLGCR